jgi:hypothetical protein
MWLFSLFLWASMNSAQAHGGDGTLVGNGGNTLYCQPGPQADFAGYYTLDYVLDFRSSGNFSKLVTAASWEASKERLAQNLERFSPVLKKSFVDFADHILKDEVAAGRAWRPWDLRSVLIDDQQITRRLPGNCYVTTGAGSVPDLHQTVVRRYSAQAVEYLYQQDILENLRLQDPLQFSFFIVHEWLWDFTENVRDLRQLNWILHSEDLATLKPEALNDFFVRTQFFSRDLPACNRSPAVKAQLETQSHLPCEKITDANLAQVEALDLSNLPKDYIFRAGDLSRLYGLKTLNLQQNPGVLEALPPYAFMDLLNLEKILAKGSGFTELPEHLNQGPTHVVIAPE